MRDSTSGSQHSVATRDGAGRTVRLGETVDALWLLVRVNVLWALLTALGLVVLGIGPASVAAAEVLLAARHGSPVRVGASMWATYREQFVRVNLRMLPLLLVEVGALAMILLAAGGAVEGTVPIAVLGTLAAVSAGWSLSSLALIAAVPRVLDQELLVTWRLSLLLPAAMPLRCVPLIVLVLLWTLLCSLLWPLAVLAGPAAAIALAVKLLNRRTGLLLADLAAGSVPHSAA